MFNILTPNESLQILVMDDDIGSSDEVGTTTLTAKELNIPPFKPTKIEPNWHNLSYNGKQVG